MKYQVTLTQQYKTEVEADSPQEAVKQAMVEGDNQGPFAPTKWAVKELAE